MKVVIILTLVVIIMHLDFSIAETMHIDKCDNFCGGSKLNPFGKSGTCKSCCMEKGFTAGGECGDMLYRHCRCVQNPPYYPGHPPGGAYYPPGAYGAPGYPGAG